MIDATAAVRRARAAIGTEYRQSGCLEAVYGWCGSPETNQPKGRYLSAIAAYGQTVAAGIVLRMDWRNAPAGALHYWAGDPGHVALGTGGGMAVTTNAPQRVSSRRNGRAYAFVGEQSIERIGQGRGRYLGWAMWGFDHHVVADLPTLPAGSEGNTIEGEEDMPLSQDDINRVAAAVWAERIGEHGNASMPNAPAGQLLPRTFVQARTASARALAAANGVKGIKADVDAAAVAAELRELLGPEFAAEVVDELGKQLSS